MPEVPAQAADGGSPLVTIVLIVGGLLFVAIVVALVIIQRRRPKNLDALEARLAEYSERDTPMTLQEIELSASFAERIIYPTLDKLAAFAGRFMPAQIIEETQHKLELADNPNNLTPTRFLAIRFGAMIVLAGLIFVLMSIAKMPLTRRFLFTAVVAALGFFLPVLWLGSKIKSRQSEIVKQLPDALDLLTICVEAGLGFDQAVGKLVEKSDGELPRAFNRYLREVALGKLNRDALLSMSARMEVSDVTTFVAAIVQAQQLGVSMAKILRVQSEQMRRLRRQRAEEKAHQAPVKMVFPMVFLTFPSIFIMLLGPAALLMMESGVLGAI
ncbi:MAG: type II secretion system F family protein [Anaerolineae bacterium]|nr:type II secretion system F family protein [Anaerolineae bacterium]